MKRLNTIALGVLALIGAAAIAYGQSSPGFVTGQILGADQLNAAFASKWDYPGYIAVNKAGDSMQGLLVTKAASSGGAGFRLPEGISPTSPGNGALWTTTAGLFVQIEGTTIGPLTTGANVSCGQLPAFTGQVTTSAGSCVTSIPNGAFTNVAQTYTKAQRGQPEALTIGGSTFTPQFDNGQNFTLTLVHASCPCTFANPSTTPVPGQAGVIVVTQSSTGSDTITTWGSDYTAAGGVATLTLSTAANARDYLSYYVDDTSHIVLSMGVQNATH